jgi:hypothetical protein
MTDKIHRLLDEAFAGVDMTAEVQDLKEEMRTNLLVRVAELERTGLAADEAAQRAISELGDIRSVIDETRTSARSAAPWVSQRVRPRPGYVVRTVILATTALAPLAAVVSSTFSDAVPRAWQVVSVAVLAIVGGSIVADALRQETTANHPLPRPRAFGYGAAAALALAGAGCVTLAVRGEPLPWLVAGGVAVAASIVGFTYLGATQTNRHKPWVVRLQAQHQEIGDRFSHDPAAAARFGLYTVAIWLVALAGFVVLGIAVGWAWSWLALLAGLVAMMITLARTLFAP